MTQQAKGPHSGPKHLEQSSRVICTLLQTGEDIAIYNQFLNKTVGDAILIISGLCATKVCYIILITLKTMTQDSALHCHFAVQNKNISKG